AGVTGQPSIVVEQQADCFAGSWLAHLARNESPYLRPTESDLRGAFAGMLAFSDQPGTTSTQPQAHGSGFDRVGAFQDGFTNGAAKCATYASNPPSTIDLPVSENDRATGGNLSFDQIVPLTVKDLDRFWSKEFATLGKSYTAPAGNLQPY